MPDTQLPKELLKLKKRIETTNKDGIISLEINQVEPTFKPHPSFTLELRAKDRVVIVGLDELGNAFKIESMGCYPMAGGGVWMLINLDQRD